MNDGVNLQHLQWGIPTDAFPCWVISEADRLDSLRNKKPFRDYKPSCYFRPTKRLDNIFIEGNLGHTDFKGKYHANISLIYDYFQRYVDRKPVYFSFDRVSLYKLITIDPTTPLTLTLKRIDAPQAIVPNTAFMIMPFNPEPLTKFYKDYIKTFLKDKMQIDIRRADDFNGNDIIIETIYNKILEAEFIIADISLNNKNAFYELGWAVAMEKEVITIQDRNIDKIIFFDRVHVRSLMYSTNEITQFQQQLHDTIIAIREKVAAKH